MNQDVVADASSMAGTIKETGRIALYGIYFNVAKANVKDESEPTLQEIAKLLKACGAGPIAPVASNETEEGRAFNRRVELVKQ
jgi:OOP family OmpA-OmpF porin